MGLSDGVYFLSWFIQFLIYNTGISFIIAIILSYVVFLHVEFIWVLLTIWLFGMCIFALAYFFQSFMDKSRVALIFAILCYFVMYFLSLVALSDTVSNSLKMLISLLPPSCMQLGILVLFQFEVILINILNLNNNQHNLIYY